MEQLCNRSQDAVELVLNRLPARSLAGLASASCALRSLVAALPPAVWRQAALADYPAQHPVQRAACTLMYLRRQNIVHASIASGSPTTSTLLTGEGAVADDLRLHASLDLRQKVCTPSLSLSLSLTQPARAFTMGLTESGSAVQRSFLRISELATGQTVQRLRLPDSLDYCRPQDLLFSPDGQTVIVRYGCAWALELFLLAVRDVDVEAPAGLVFASLQDASCKLVELPSQEAFLQAGHPAQCAMSSAGSLIVLHVDEADDVSLSVYDAAGSVTASVLYIPYDHLTDSQNLHRSDLIWSPDAQSVAFHLAGHPSFNVTRLCFWRPGSTAQDSFDCIDLTVPMAGNGAGRLVWSPCSSKLLVQFDPCNSMIVSRDGDTITDQAVRGGHMCPVWGVSALCSLGSIREEKTHLRSLLMVARQLRWFTAQGGDFQPPFAAVGFSGRVSEMQPVAVSPDGSHAAFVSWDLALDLPDNHALLRPRLEIVSATGRRCLQLPLAVPPTDRFWSLVSNPERLYTIACPTWASYTMRWAADGSALLCSFTTGEQHLLVTFA